MVVSFSYVVICLIFGQNKKSVYAFFKVQLYFLAIFSLKLPRYRVMELGKKSKFYQGIAKSMFLWCYFL